MSTRRDHSLRTHQPEPPALGHAHGHCELTVGHIQDGLALTHHQGAAAIAVWAEASVGVAWRGKKRQVSPQHTDHCGPMALSWVQGTPDVSGEEGLGWARSHYVSQLWSPMKAR